MRLVWQLLAVATVAFIGGRLLTLVDGKPWLTLLVGVLTALSAVPVYRWVARRTENRPATDLASGGAWGAMGRGVLIGAAAITAVIAHIAIQADYSIDGWGSLEGAIAVFGFMAAVAVTEELLFRGVLFRIAEERLGTWAALISTSLLFGSMHLFNENATLWGAFAITIAGGGMLTAAYVATRSLWVPIGLHFGWNFAQSGIFGNAGSGNAATHGLLETSTSGSTWVTGGVFGPEASVYTVLLGVLVTAAFMWLAQRRGHVMPGRGRAGRASVPATLAR